MGNNNTIVLDISQDVGTKELDRLWREYAGDAESIPPKTAHKFLKAFAKVFFFTVPLLAIGMELTSS